MDSFLSPTLIWFIIGLVFILLEFIIPGVIVIFFGVGAWINSLLLLIMDFGVNTQLVIFLVTSIVCLVILRKKVQSIFVGKTEETTGDDVDNIIGKKVKVVEKISPDVPGKVLLNGTQWKAEADEEISEETIVEIISKNNLTLKVKTKESEND